METIDQTYSLELFSAQAITRAAHRFGATHSTQFVHEKDLIRVILTPRAESDSDVQTDLGDAVLDESLRETVRNQTSTLHETLVAASFKGLPGKPA